MVNYVAHDLKVDKQGRIIIPADIRKQLNINNDSLLEISVVANQIIIRKRSNLSHREVDEWSNALLEMDAPPNPSSTEQYTEKWMSESYARNKLGL